MARHDGRRSNELRPVKMTRRYIRNAEGSVLIEMGSTRVVCTATVEDTVPHFLRGTGKGWITAEYGMIPRSSASRIPRESIRGRVKGRTHEIQRMIGRALRAVADLEALGERTVIIDCDVIEADGGTRTASITGGFVALADALRASGLDDAALRGYVAAVGVGLVGGKALLDLDYSEDSTAEVDMNFVMDGESRYIEIQGTAEGRVFGEDELERMKALAKSGVKRLVAIQKNALGRK
ncbi:MAG TPA: ribonuclease PH [Candidatus Eisenbacteria bacterium]|uniref:Ribonuclease PH n=1 Tax=Eiseniibacteriota bacterium TaxID=2212470 RepID=A0A7V2F347_UNCEI|nr:ribonuclease PH [Candidatus Eisenbacteria bacterium]